MSDRKVNHFLVVYDIPQSHAVVSPYGDDYDAALEAYEAAEEQHREDPQTEVVLLGSDSLETLRRTHSSYFELREHHIDQLVARELAEAGVR